MIFLNFLFFMGIYGLSAHLSGDLGAVVNGDSMLIVSIGLVCSTLTLGMGRLKALGAGIGMLFSFRAQKRGERETKQLFLGIACMTFGVGLISTLQGIYSGVFSAQDLALEKVVLLASFTAVYAAAICLFLLLPVVYRCAD